ncbi:MAG TPA: hypothetical protein VF469_15550 [Kofleriaceae bacterium]
MTHPTTDRQALLDSLLTSTAIGMPTGDAARMRELLDELVRDWLREAGTDDDAPAVIDLLRKDFNATVAGKPGPARLEVVRAQVLDRRIRRLGVQTFALGKQLVDGGVSRDEARSRGEALMKEIDAVASQVRALADAGARARLGRDLQEASMEALYAIEGKAMSLRLNHYASDAQAPRVS